MVREECGVSFHCCQVEQAQVAKQLVTRLQAPCFSLQCFPRAGFSRSLGWRRGRTEADVSILTQTLLPALPLHWETHPLPTKCLFTGLLHIDTHPHGWPFPRCGPPCAGASLASLLQSDSSPGWTDRPTPGLHNPENIASAFHWNSLPWSSLCAALL